MAEELFQTPRTNNDSLVIKMKTFYRNVFDISRTIQIPANTSALDLTRISACLFQVNMNSLCYFTPFVTALELQEDDGYRSFMNMHDGGHIWDAETSGPTAVASLFIKDDNFQKISLQFSMSGDYEDIVMEVVGVESDVRELAILESNGAISESRPTNISDLQAELDINYVGTESPTVNRRRSLKEYFIED